MSFSDFVSLTCTWRWSKITEALITWSATTRSTSRRSWRNITRCSPSARLSRLWRALRTKNTMHCKLIPLIQSSPTLSCVIWNPFCSPKHSLNSFPTSFAVTWRAFTCSKSTWKHQTTWLKSTAEQRRARKKTTWSRARAVCGCKSLRSILTSPDWEFTMRTRIR